MDVTLSVDRSAIPGGGKASITVTASENIYAVECRATLSGAPWGRGVGTDVLADDLQTTNGYYELPAPSESFSFDVESGELVSGDGTYRITVYTCDSRGVWDDTNLYIPSGSDKLITSDGLTFCVQKGGAMADYNSAYTGLQHDEAVALAQTAAQKTEFGSTTIATSAWALENSPTYSDYPYAATVTGLTGVTANMFAEVIFAPSDAASGNLAAVCATGANSVTVYAKTVPSSTVTVLGIIVWG